MPQPWGQLVRRDHIVVWGMTGCGKSPFAADLVRDARRVLYFDTGRDWSDEGENICGALVAEMVDDLGAEAAAKELLAGTFLRLSIQPTKTDVPEEFKRVHDLARAAAPQGGLVMLIDEIHRIKSRCEELLVGLHSDGHKDGVATVMCSPCFTDVPLRCRNTASRVFCFYQKNRDDISAAAGEYGDDFATQAAGWRYPKPPAVWTNPTLHS
jgi:hypothetical protein